MSLNFPVSLCGCPPNGADLTQDLFKWHEEGNALCSHTGTGGLSMVGIPTTTSSLPTGFTKAYAPNKDEGYVNESFFAPQDFGSYTIATVLRQKTNGFGRIFWGGSNSVNGQPANLSGDAIREYGSYIQCRGNTYSTQNIWISQNVWRSIVYVKDGLTMQIYRDGVLVSDLNLSGAASTSVWRMFNSQNTDILNWVMANRSWGQADVDAFENGGAYLHYADL